MILDTVTIYSSLSSSEKFSSIELIIFVKPKRNESGKFINISDEKRLHYHIYFNNEKTETKRYYIDKNEDIFKIKVVIDSDIKSLVSLFEKCDILESIYFIKFYRNNINDMSYMFSGCSSLKHIKFLNFNTSNVVRMNFMFSDCSSLSELDLSMFDTSKVTSMIAMFLSCNSLKKLDISNFNTDNVASMRAMFFGCESLIDLEMTNFNSLNSSTDHIVDLCKDEIIEQFKRKNSKIKAHVSAYNDNDKFCLIF